MIDPAVSALMHDLIDYAGMFPPADLELEAAAIEFCQHRKQAESWMLGRFIVHYSKLDALGAQPQMLKLAEPAELSVLVGGGTAEDFEQILQEQLSVVSGFVAQNRSFSVKALEVRAPLPCRSLTAILRLIQNRLALSDLPGSTRMFIELPACREWDQQSRELVQTLREFPAIGFKMRCGGLSAETFPAPERLARILRSVVQEQIPFKATAGLHHPVRHFNSSVSTRMHGFLNVFGGAILAAANPEMSDHDLLDVVLEESAEAFRFEEGALRWRAFGATAQQITEHRQRLTSFGSCSFNEPRSDLRELRLLPGQGATGAVSAT